MSKPEPQKQINTRLIAEILYRRSLPKVIRQYEQEAKHLLGYTDIQLGAMRLEYLSSFDYFKRLQKEVTPQRYEKDWF